MSANAQQEFRKADWKVVGLRLLIFARYWAKTHYGWQEGQSLPKGKTPEDIAVEVYEAYCTGKRKLRPDVIMIVQLKSAVKSDLWNLHRLKDARLTSSEAPEFFEPYADGRPNPGEQVESEDFCRHFFERLYAETRVKKNAELVLMVKAVESGAVEVADFCEHTRLSEARVYELRRQLKDIAEKVLNNLRKDEGQNEKSLSKRNAAIA
jgi:hypothetical protein